MKANKALEARFDESERRELWLIPADRAEYRRLKRRVRAGELCEPHPGLFARKAACRNLGPRGVAYRTVKTLAYMHPTWTFCRFSAAVLHGIHVPFKHLDAVHVAVTKRHHDASTRSIKRHVCPYASVDVDGHHATSIEQTVVDCLCHSSFADGLSIADSALHWDLTSASALNCFVAENGKHRKGIVQARETLSWVDGRSESGGESQLRALIIEAGFALPELQVEMEDPMGSNSFIRVDFCWRLANGRVIICEFDGAGKYLGNIDPNGDMQQNLNRAVKKLSDERARESLINLTGATVIRITSRDLARPSYIVDLLELAGVPKR